MKNTNATLMLLQCLLSLTKFEEHFNKECLIEDNSKLLKKPKIIQIFKEIVKNLSNENVFLEEIFVLFR